MVAGVLTLAVPASGQGVVAFSSERCVEEEAPGTTGSGCRQAIYRVNDDGSGLRRLTDGGGGRDWSPAWAPGGSAIAFSRSGTTEDGHLRLFVMNADGSAQRPVIDGPLPDGYFDQSTPDWSPDGGLIAFWAHRFVGEPDRFATRAVFTVAPDGSRLRQLTDREDDASTPTFSPDGQDIAYFAAPFETPEEGGPPGLGEQGIYLMNRDGSNKRRLTFGDIEPASSGMSFSPDGRYLAITLPDGLYTMTIDGAELTRRGNQIGFAPTWSAFGPSLIYESRVGGDGPIALHMLDLSRDGPPVLLVEPSHRDSAPDWTLAATGPATPLPPDREPPLPVLGHQLSSAPGASPSRARAAASSRPFRLLVLDRSGIRNVAAAVGLRVSRRRCRFLVGERLGARRSCRRPVYRRVPSGEAWRSRTRGLGRGTYEVRVRTSDVEGNVTRRPKRRVVRVR